MSYQVFRVQRGRVWHIIHETLSPHANINNAQPLCDVKPYYGERRKGIPTCPTCLTMDNPCTLSDAERSMLARIAIRTPDDVPQIWGGHAITSLHKKDLIDKDEKLTRRGAVLALDWTVGVAAAADYQGIVHARRPLARIARCNHAPIPNELHGFGEMTVDKYARLRGLNQHVTCVQCAALQTL